MGVCFNLTSIYSLIVTEFHDFWSDDFKTFQSHFYLFIDCNSQLIYTKSEHYYNNYPKYGYEVKSNNFKKLIQDHLNERAGNSFFLRKICNGYTEFFLSVPTHYPICKDKYPLGGCIIVSNKQILIYMTKKIIFLKLYNNYLRKRVFRKEQKKCQKNKIHLPKRFSDKNLSKYIRFQNHILSREIVETVKKITPKKSFLVFNSKKWHLNNESITPISELTSQIIHKLQYDGILADTVSNGLKNKMTCPKCGHKIPEKNDDDRILLRDIIVSKIKENWECKECKYSINPLIMVAKNIIKTGDKNE